jgi:hypothetical protein
MMMTEMDIETSVHYVHLTRLIARENFIICGLFLSVLLYWLSVGKSNLHVTGRKRRILLLLLLLLVVVAAASYFGAHVHSVIMQVCLQHHTTTRKVARDSMNDNTANLFAS